MERRSEMQIAFYCVIAAAAAAAVFACARRGQAHPEDRIAISGNIELFGGEHCVQDGGEAGRAHGE